MTPRVKIRYAETNGSQDSSVCLLQKIIMVQPHSRNTSKGITDGLDCNNADLDPVYAERQVEAVQSSHEEDLGDRDYRPGVNSYDNTCGNGTPFDDDETPLVDGE